MANDAAGAHRPGPRAAGCRTRRPSGGCSGPPCAMVHRTGLTVSLDHISFEDVIRDADVSRSSVYRRWPYKDLFFSDLVKELAMNATPTIVADEAELIRRVVAEQAGLARDARAAARPDRRAVPPAGPPGLRDVATDRRTGAPTWRCTRRT